MRATWILCIAALSAGAFAPFAAAQLSVTDTYPFATCFSVASDASTSPDTIYAGAGSGIYVLDGSTSDEPSLMTSGGVANKLHASGVVRDIALTASKVYAAAGRTGVSRFTRGSTSSAKDWLFTDVAAGGAAWAVDVPTQVGNHDLVFIGTNDNDSSGVLYMIDANAQNNDMPQILDEWDVDSPIYALASHYNATNHSLILLVGTACGTVGDPAAPASLYRFDFSNLSSGLPTAIPSWDATWAATSTSADPCAGSLVIRACERVDRACSEVAGAAARRRFPGARRLPSAVLEHWTDCDRGPDEPGRTVSGRATVRVV